MRFTFSHVVPITLIAVAAVGRQAGAEPSAFSEGPPPVLNPKTYKSPSAEFELFVDPSTMNGQGEGTYRLTRKGKVVWSGKHPFTLWEAGVTDVGIVAGYAYTHGWRGFPPDLL